MKLAEALIERADLQRNVENLRARLCRNAKVQEGLVPNESPDILLTEMTALLSRLEFLIVHINQTNAQTRLADGQTIAEKIAQKDVLSKRIALLQDLLEAGSDLVNRMTHSEIKVTATFSVAAIQKEVDTASKELRLLDIKLQEANWLTELL